MKAINSATKQKSLMALLILLVSLAKVNYTNAHRLRLCKRKRCVYYF
jgi:hypothetical protein